MQEKKITITIEDRTSKFFDNIHIETVEDGPSTNSNRLCKFRHPMKSNYEEQKRRASIQEHYFQENKKP